MNKEIHVNSYTKKDGTKVREHYRNIVTNGFVPEQEEMEPPNDCWGHEEKNPLAEILGIPDHVSMVSPGTVLTGGVEVNVPLPAGGDVLTAVISVTVGVTIIAAKTAYALYKAAQEADQSKINTLKPQLNVQIQNIKNNYTNLEKIANKYLEKLVNTKDSTEYKNLLKNYTVQRELVQKTKDALARIDYAAANNDYETLYNEMRDYSSNFSEVIEKTRAAQPLNKAEYRLNISNKNIDSDFNKAVNNKVIYDFSADIAKHLPAIDHSYEFWNAFSNDFAESQQYIEGNGNLVYSVSELPSQDLQKTVSKKLMQQFKKPDTLGVIFKPESSLSKAISDSETMKEFFRKNAKTLLNGESIKTTSEHFDIYKNFDLWATYAYADILYSTIDSNGNLCAIVFDTYDFNEGEFVLIEMARTVEEAGLGREFYSLAIVIIPAEEWINWII